LNYIEGKTIQPLKSITVQRNASYRIPAIIIGHHVKAGQKIDLKGYYTLIAPNGKKILDRELVSQAKFYEWLQKENIGALFPATVLPVKNRPAIMTEIRSILSNANRY